MVLGDTMSMLLKLEVDISELAKLQQARTAVKNFESGAVQGMERVSSKSRGAVNDIEAANRALGLSGNQALTTGTNFERLSRNIGSVSQASRAASVASTGALGMIAEKAMGLAGSVKEAVGSVQQLRIAFLNMMFAGMNAVFLFGAILALSPRIRAGFSSLVASLRLVAVEAGEILGPKLRGLAKAIRNLDEDQKELLATISVVGTVFGVLLTVTGVLGGLFLTTAKAAAVFVNGLRFLKTQLLATSVAQSIMSNGLKATLIGALKKVKTVITTTVIPALKRMGVAMYGALGPAGILIGVIAALIIVFIKFKSVRKLFVDTTTAIGNAMLDLRDAAVFKLKHSLTELAITGTKVRKAMLKTAKSLAKGIFNKFQKGIKLAREFAKSMKAIPFVDVNMGELPKAEDFKLDTSGLDKSITTAENQIQDLKDLRQTVVDETNEDVKENKKIAQGKNARLDEIFRTNEDLTITGLISEFLGGEGKEDDDDETPGSAAVPNLSGLKDGNFRNIAGMRENRFRSRMEELSNSTRFQTDDASTKKENNTFNNEIRMEDIQVDADRDIDRLADQIIERMERKQRRNKAAP